MDDLLAPMHIVVLLIVALLIFGPKRLPHLGSDLAKGIKAFQQELHGSNTLSAHVPSEDSQNPNSSSNNHGS
ncbi:twin-arginine translocase TatA/TatE family subunit [Sulfobacillus thermosulfidooxidans]|uniref:twin-arginine translocase TatA/TatE family subunit n=1 Tax=Sulfobacillus thermosulfidooxidans TaxID=28034 RepID=UPI000311FEDB|nr:twin-arginine translocase TatA/TatE family subunit [Sulfobacillus thermosulfidooxidans]